MSANVNAILLVEDDENDIFFFERAAKLAEIHHPLHVVRNGQEAIDFFTGAGEYSDRNRFPTPGFVVLDLNLPYRNGFDVLQFLRDHPHTRLVTVVVFTSSTAERDVSRAYSLGANSYLVKRPTPEGLVDLLQLMKSYWFDANVAAPLHAAE